jgi:hypothetical protein
MNIKLTDYGTRSKLFFKLHKGKRRVEIEERKIDFNNALFETMVWHYYLENETWPNPLIDPSIMNSVLEIPLKENRIHG